MRGRTVARNTQGVVGCVTAAHRRLALLHPDVASLRRYLVDFKFMSRDHGQYRLNPTNAWPV
jgi:hypothetical protein